MTDNELSPLEVISTFITCNERDYCFEVAYTLT